MVRFVGVPTELEASAPQVERDRVSAVLRSILPVSMRVNGIRVDSATQLTEWPLEKMEVPTLIVSAEDDLFRSLPGARFTAERMKGAELKVLESGGHLMVGRWKEVRQTIAIFLTGIRGTDAPAMLERP
jgi:2-hydroxy-6-oxonona-2,4-dienedioate hydrolase